MLHSDPCNEVVVALVAVHAELKDPEKSRKVDAGAKKYSYAELDKCLPDIRALLAGKGMLVTQSLMAPDIMITTLYHISGQWIRSECPVTLPAKASDPQAFGSSITYARRYSLFMALGLAAQNEDNDGAQPTSKDRKRETPDAKNARQASHDADWPKEHKPFIFAMKATGFPDLDEMSSFLESQGGKRPSQRTSAQRKELLAKMNTAEFSEAYTAWMLAENERKAGGGEA